MTPDPVTVKAAETKTSAVAPRPLYLYLLTTCRLTTLVQNVNKVQYRPETADRTENSTDTDEHIYTDVFNYSENEAYQSPHCSRR